jgi:hypothetical protein
LLAVEERVGVFVGIGEAHAGAGVVEVHENAEPDRRVPPKEA